MISLKRIGICIAAMTITAAGCGEVTLNPDAATPDTGPGPTGPCQGEVAVDDAWQCLVNAACDVIAECFGGAFSVEQCRELDLELMGLSGRYGDILLQGAIAQGTLTYDSAAMTQCLDALSQMTCLDVFENGNDPFAVCRPFKGAIANDSVCYFDLECATLGAECVATTCEGQVCCQGTCVAPAPVGSACVGRPCVPGAHCVNDACTSGVAGDTCRYSSDCDTDHWCAQGVCQPDAATGGSCSTDDQCAYPELCLGDAAGAPGTCTRAAQVGDACDDGCLPFTSLYCNRPDASAPGTCEPRVGEGNACDPERGECQINLRCDTTLRVCIPGQQLNQACDSGLPCEFYSGLHCTSEIDGAATGICEGPLAAGQACRFDSHCVSGYCYQDVCTDVVACY
jgi:hypothetical protein